MRHVPQPALVRVDVDTLDRHETAGAQVEECCGNGVSWDSEVVGEKRGESRWLPAEVERRLELAWVMRPPVDTDEADRGQPGRRRCRGGDEERGVAGARRGTRRRCRAPDPGPPAPRRAPRG